MKNYFPGNEYHTSPDTKRAMGDYLLFGSRWYFYINILMATLDAQKRACNGSYDDSAWIESSYRMFKAHEKSGAKCHFTGLDNIAKHDGPVVFVGNHMSTSETFLLPSIIVPHKKVTFVVKESLTKYPVFGPVMRSRNPIAVSRKDPREDFKTVMNEGKARIDAGVSVVVFPQSTRMEQFEPENFNTIGIKLAKKTGVPIVPFALDTSFWSNGSFLKDAGPIRRNHPVRIEFSEPLIISGNGKDEHAKVIDFITTKLAEWKKEY